MVVGAAQYETDLYDGVLRMLAKGDWRARNLGSIDHDLRAFEDDTVGRDLIVDVSGLTKLDTAGAMVLQRILNACTERGSVSGIEGASDAHSALLEQVAPHLAPCAIEPMREFWLKAVADRVGRGVIDAHRASLHVMSFIGETLVTVVGLFRRPQRFRLTSTVHHMEATGVNAMPIIGLMSFLIGAVVAFMGAKILQAFNASVFTVELVGIAVLREFGVLLAAILLAGRSGSAFTAQIGSMKLREEIDAMDALGLNPMEVLVVPRVIALMIMLPLLTVGADILGITGGLLVAWFSMDISPALFLTRMQDAIGIQNFWVGLIKAPFFAFVIAVIGCFQGMEVEGSAESLGQRTTLSVVQSLFVVIVLDAFFAMFFLELEY